MKFGDFANSGFAIEGWKKLQIWIDDEAVIIAEGYNLERTSQYLGCEVLYVFPYIKEDGEAAICIELEEER